MTSCEESGDRVEDREETAETQETILDEGTAAGPIAAGTYPWLVSVGGSCGGALVASNVVITAAHCVDINYGDYDGEQDDGFDNSTPFSGVTQAQLLTYDVGDEVRDVVAAMNASGLQSAAVAHPSFNGGMQGSDIAVLVFNESIPRRVLTPARVGKYPTDPVSSHSTVLSMVKHKWNDSDPWNPNRRCVQDVAQRTFLKSTVTSAEVDDDGLAYWNFETPNSHTCKGDSGSPIISGSYVVSVVSTGDNDNEHQGPDLTGPALRGWLLPRALDRDADGYEAWEDKCDWDANWPKGRQYPQHDEDGDGISPPCDPCDDEPAVPRPAGLVDDALDDWNSDHDPDGDGFPSCLDACPDDAPSPSTPSACAATERGKMGDSDCDGICDGDEVCDLVASSVPVVNSNLEAELAWSADVMPDDCDPVLVPRGAIDTTKTTIEYLQTSDNTFFKEQFWRERNDWVTRQHRASRSVDASPPASVSVASVATHVRFCQPNAVFVPDCLAEDLINSSELRLSIGALDETPDMGYHRVSMGTGARGASVSRTYDDSAESVQWRYDEDANFWSNNEIVDVPADETNTMFPGATASGLDGTMWFHSQSQVGHPGLSSNDVGTGIHQAVENISNTSQLASSYFAIDPESLRGRREWHPLELDKPYFAWRDLPRWPDRDWLWGVDPFDDVMIFETRDDDFGVLTDSGRLLLLEDILSTGVRTRLSQTGVRWLSSEEPNSMLAAAGAPIAAVLAADGTSIVDAVYSSPDGQTLRNRIEAGAPAQVDVVPTTNGFGAVYARSMGSVFRIGGSSGGPSSSTPGGLWRFDLTKGTAIELKQHIATGTILSVSFDPIARELVVLDRVPRLLSGYDIRLLRFDAFGRSAREVKRWIQDGPCGGYDIAVDGRQRILVSANRATSAGHSLYALQMSGTTVTSRRLVSTSGSLATAPWANEKTIYLPVTSGGQTTVVRVDAALNGTSVDIAECF